MTNLRMFVIASVLSIWPAGWTAGWTAGAPQVGSFEKQALSSVQEMLASDLDAELPGRPFAIWFSRLIGPKAGVVWQLAECGEPIVAPDKTWQDLPACAEANVSLPDGRKVFVVISVGTFKKGLTGKPAFFSAVVEHNEQLYQVRRLSVLPEMLRAPDALADYQPATNTTNRIVNLPVIKGYSARIIAPFHYLSSLSSRVPFVNDRLSPVEASPAAPTPPPTPPPTLPPTLMADLLEVPEKVPESELQGLAITRVKPVYPPSAKKMNAAGTVEVQITISEEGLVVEATAISGHFALRSAAVEAARKWVFKPAIFNGAPVKVKSVLTFVFAPSAK